MNQIVDELTEADEKKLVNCSAFLDLAKAYNTINHKILQIIMFIEQQKKYAQKVWSEDLVYKKPFGYRVIHQNSLTSCPGPLQYLFSFVILFKKLFT